MGHKAFWGFYLISSLAIALLLRWLIIGDESEPWMYAVLGVIFVLLAPGIGRLLGLDDVYATKPRSDRD